MALLLTLLATPVAYSLFNDAQLALARVTRNLGALLRRAPEAGVPVEEAERTA